MNLWQKLVPAGQALIDVERPMQQKGCTIITMITKTSMQERLKLTSVPHSWKCVE